MDIEGQNIGDIAIGETIMNESERRQEVVLKYEQAIRDLILSHSDDLRNIGDGEKDGLKWRQTLSSGKQKPVCILEFTFPEGFIFELVIKVTSQEFMEIYEKYPVVRKHYPHIYLNQKVPYFKDAKEDVLVVEKINGYEEKLDKNKEFDMYIDNPENFEQMCKEVFDIADEILDQQLRLVDVMPTNGHNVIFNTDTGHFQLFDIDTVQEWPESKVSKFMEFIDPMQVRDNKNTAFVVRMIQLYLQKNPESQLSYFGQEYRLGEYIKLSEDSTEEGLIHPGDSNYEKAYKSFDWRGTMDRKNLPPIKLVVRKGRDRFFINEKLIEAAKEGDMEKAKEAIKECRGKIVEKVFVSNE